MEKFKTMMRKNLIFASLCFGILLTALILQSIRTEGKEKELREISEHERVLVTDILESIPQEQRAHILKEIETVDEENIADLFLVQAKKFSETH
jgi:hypothetical protein